MYDSHLSLLKNVFDEIGPQKLILEFGMGLYSTYYLLDHCEKLISIEMQEKNWFDEINNVLQHNEKWTGIESLGPLTFLELNLPDHIDLCFVDGHGDSRPECINNAFLKKVPIVIAHDTEWPHYGWDRVKKNNYLEIIDKRCPVWTTMWTTNQKLHDKIKEKVEL